MTELLIHVPFNFLNHFQLGLVFLLIQDPWEYFRCFACPLLVMNVIDTKIEKLILPPWICYISADSFSPLLLWPHTFSALPTNSHACRPICSLQYYTSDNFQDSKSWPDVSQLHICIFSCPTDIFLEMLSKRFQCYIWRISSSWPYVHPDTLSKHHVLV